MRTRARIQRAADNFEFASYMIELQRMTKDDIGNYLAFEKRAESRIYAAAQNRQEAEEEFADGSMYFIKFSGEVVGTASYSRKEDRSVYINGLAVDPDFRGRGLGRKALAKILEQVRDADRVWLVVHPENISAMKLYESFGFKTVERRENFHGDGEPRVVFSRDQFRA